MRRVLRIVLLTVAWLVGIFAVIQLVPYGRTHSNPPTTKEPAWSARTRALAKRACFDCHSNETRWPWYANLAPFSWVVQHDVEGARTIVNFSEWDRTYPLAPYCGQSLRFGMMPPLKYRVAHPEAALTNEETRELADTFDDMFGAPNRR